MSLTLSQILPVLEELAPLHLAGEWDNVGLLVEPEGSSPIERVLLTIDLTEDVLAEAIVCGTGLILAYHPPIFRPLKRLTLASSKERIVIRALGQGIALYSPHTALDAVSGGVNDWLAAAVGDGSIEVLEPARDESGGIICGAGQGRRVRLSRPLGLGELTERIKSYLGLESLRVAAAPDHAAGETVESIALCPGAGVSVIANHAAGLYLTGEMSHHEVLAANAGGISVILTEHSNSERGYLPHLREKLASATEGGGVEWMVSKRDDDPLRVA